MLLRSSALLVHVVACAALGCLACTQADESAAAASAPAVCAAPSRRVGEQCLGPGVADDGCAAGTLGAEDGSCRPAGIAPGQCAEGFSHDGDVGCEPVLPAEACPAGRMAVPGDTECRAVMPCGAGRWGDIPVEDGTQYVDASYAGAGSDGSESKPWTTITEAFEAAAPGGLIAVAAGSYAEDVTLSGKPARIWGVCPDEVEIVGSDYFAAVFVRENADGSELHGVAVRSAALGIVVSGSIDVTLDRVWVHETARSGMEIHGSLGATTATVTGSLVEESHIVGILAAGTEATLDATVVRDVLPFTQQFGRGISLEPLCTSSGECDANAPTVVAVRRSLVERSREVGLFVWGAEATIDATVVRDTLPVALDDTKGRGIVVQESCSGGVCDAPKRANATVRGSFVANNHEMGIYVVGSDATIETTVVRDTLSEASNLEDGWGISVVPSCGVGGCEAGSHAALTVRSSLVERSHAMGLLVGAAEATIESTVVRDTLPSDADKRLGTGIGIQLACFGAGCDPAWRATAALRGCVVERNHEAGVLVAGSDATLDTNLVRGTLPQAASGDFGDGLAVMVRSGAPAGVAVTSSVIDASARAGVSAFGAAVSMGTTAVRCAGFALEGETFEGQSFAFDDLGDNACGCPEAESDCQATSEGLAPPAPMGMAD